jgi:membrane protein YqaA with SNARE-associated domain
MLKRLYFKLMGFAAHGYALPVLGLVAFLESSVFPIPPDAFLIPLVLANPARAWRFAATATIFSVLGGLLGYGIGFYFSDTIGHWIIRLYGSDTAYSDLQDAFARYGLWIILIKGLTPIPYKLVTITAGIAHFNLITFIWSSLVTRGFRFFLLAFLAWKFGPAAMPYIERNLARITVAVLILAIAGVVAVHYLA